MYISAALAHCDLLLSCIDQPRVGLVWRRRRAHANQAVFRMDDNFPVERDIISDGCRNTNAEIDAPAFWNIVSDPRRHTVTAKRLEVYSHIHVRGLPGSRFIVRHVDNAVDVYARCDDMFRVQLPKISHMLRLNNGQISRHRHDRVKVTP